MNDHSSEDPAGDVASGIGRATSAVAAQAARVLADRLRERVEALRVAKLEEAQRLGAIWDADRAASVAQVKVAREISGVTDEDLRLTVEAWKTADAWAQVDPAFVDDAREIRRQLEERWGVDVNRPDERTATATSADQTKPAAVAREEAAGVIAEADAAAERARARDEDTAAQVDEATAMAVAAGTADEVQALEDATQHRANASVHETRAAEYDSDARRAQLAQRVEDGGADRESVHARSVAANANAKPVRTVALERSVKKPAVRRRGDLANERSSQLGR